jgi:hypothetical protein
MNEDFVSFDLGMKLKEKGFREKVNAYYGKRENLFDVHPALDTNDSEYRCSAPTISQVLKWLREEKAISVEPYASASGWRVTICRAYHQDRCDAGGGTCLKEEVIGYNDGGAFEKYEEAAIAGIEYALDNLI